MTIENWKPTTGGKRVGTFDLTMPSGIVLKQCSLVKGENGEFIGLPQTAWTNNEGQKKYTSVVEIPDKDIRQRFTDAVIRALRELGV